MVKCILKFINGSEANAQRQGIIWNAAASMAYSVQSAILLLVVTRAGGLYTAGVFSISYTVSQMFASVGSYSMRSYQVSDVKNRFSFGTYLASRYFTIVIMLLTCMAYSLLHGYNGEKLAVLMMLSAYRAVDGFEDVYHGEFQKRGRLDISAKIVAIRIISVSLLFSIVFIISKNLMLSVAVMLLSAIALSFLFNFTETSRLSIIGKIEIKEVKAVKQLLFSCFPVCIGAFLYNYLVNSPKYAIDSVLSEDMQTIFNIIFMPVFVINMLGGFVFQPYILKMGIAWNREEVKEFATLVIKQVVIIFGITIVVAVTGALAGIPVLSWVYGVDLSDYSMLFIILLMFGGVSALNTFGSVVLTVMRRQAYILIAYFVALLVNIILMNKIVEKYELWGAGLVYGLAMGIILLVFIGGILTGLLKKHHIHNKYKYLEGEEDGN